MIMTREEITAKIIELAAAQADVPVGVVTRTTHFVNDLNFDSLDVMEFAMSVEDTLGVTIADDQIDELQTVGDVIEYVGAHLKEVPAS
jgi:acyl carrier protein